MRNKIRWKGVSMYGFSTYVSETDMDTAEVLDILGIYLLDASENPEHRQQALDWAMGNERIAQAIVFSVEDWIEFQIDRLDRQQQSGRGI
ncbi:hypothetical protein [Parapedobacter sp. 2B3]|uniref:hypothetical protein n=1 Tax=Parapedobacter sp. 2B3 TaxID=3342381 RepID=UPI0035B6A47A